MNDSRGTARRAPGEHLWLLLCAPGIKLFYFTTDGHREVPVFDDTWGAKFYSGTDWHGPYYLYAVIVNTEDSQRLDQTREKFKAKGDEPPYIDQLPPSARYFSVVVQCCS